MEFHLIFWRPISILIYSRIVLTSYGHHMILFIYLELSHLIPEELHNFSQSLFVVLYFKFLERDENRGSWPASVILIGLDWIDTARQQNPSGNNFGVDCDLSHAVIRSTKLRM